MFAKQPQVKPGILELLSNSPGVEDLVYLMGKFPTLNYQIMEAFKRFKEENGPLVDEALKNQ
ncbi:MAG: hypothetical protein GY940_43830 [bacterium]|nr:hypothetical protein [bacterium]